MTEQIDRDLEDKEQMEYIRNYEEIKKRRYREDMMELRRRRDLGWYKRFKEYLKPGSIDRSE